MITKNVIHKYFQDYAGLNYQIKYFGYGDLSEISVDEATTYPLMWVQPVPSTIEGNEISYNYNILFADRLLDGDSNDVEIESDTFQMCLDILASLRNNNEFDWELEKSATAEPFIHRFKDRVAGHLLSVSFLVEFNYDECAIPQSGSPIPPSSLCEGVVIRINDTAFTTAASGTIEEIEVRNTDGDLVGSLINGIWVVPVGGVCADATAVVKNTVGTIIISEAIPSGQSEDIIVGDSDITINSAAFSSTPATVDLNIVVKDGNGTAVGSKVGSEWIVPSGATQSGSLLQWVIGMEYTSFRTGDEGWRLQNGFYPYTPPTYPLTIAQLDLTLGVNYFWRLKQASTVNGVTSTIRFVDVDGGQTYSATGDKDRITIDKLTGLGFYRKVADLGGLKTWNNAVDDAVAFSTVVNGVTYNTWYIASLEDFRKIFGEEGSVSGNNMIDPLSSINVFLFPAGTPEFWTATTQMNSGGGNAYSKGYNPSTYTRPQAKTSTYLSMYIFDARNLIS